MMMMSLIKSSTSWFALDWLGLVIILTIIVGYCEQPRSEDKNKLE